MVPFIFIVSLILSFYFKTRKFVATILGMLNLFYSIIQHLEKTTGFTRIIENNACVHVGENCSKLSCELIMLLNGSMSIFFFQLTIKCNIIQIITKQSNATIRCVASLRSVPKRREF